MGTVSYNNIEYDIWVCAPDIHLQSPEQDIVIRNGYTEVEGAAILDKAIYVNGYLGRELDYNHIDVMSRIADTIEPYCLKYLKSHA